MNRDNLILNKTNEYYFVKCATEKERIEALEELHELGFKQADGGDVRKLSSNELAITAKEDKILYIGYPKGHERVNYYKGIFTTKTINYENLLI